MPSQRLKTRSNFPRRTRSTQRPSLLTGTRTTSVAQSISAVSTASIASSSWTSGALPSADKPSKSSAIFIASSSACLSASGEHRLAGCNSWRYGLIELDALTRGRESQAALNQLVIADARGAGSFRQTRIFRRIRKNSRQRIHFQNVRIPRSIETDVDARPIPAAEDSISVEHNLLDCPLKLAADLRGTLEDFQRPLRPIPHELRVEAVDRERSFRQRAEVHADDRQNNRFITVAEHATSEFPAGKVLLHQNRLTIVLEQELRLDQKLIAVATKIAVGDSFRRSLMQRLDEKREVEATGSRV